MAKPHDEGSEIPWVVTGRGAIFWRTAIQKRCWPRLGNDVNKKQNLLWLATKIWELCVKVAGKHILIEFPRKLEWFHLSLTKDPVCTSFSALQMIKVLTLDEVPRNDPTKPAENTLTCVKSQVTYWNSRQALLGIPTDALWTQILQGGKLGWLICHFTGQEF